MAPKLGFQFEAPTWVALYVYTGNPKSRARFRCPELSCFWNPFEFNNNWNQLTDKQDFFYSILFASRKTKNAVDTRVLGLLNLSLAGIQDKAVLHCSFSHCGGHFGFPTFLGLIPCPLFVSPNPHTFHHPHTSTLEQPAEPSRHTRKHTKPLCTHKITHTHTPWHTRLSYPQNVETTTHHTHLQWNPSEHTKTPLQGVTSKTPCLTTLSLHTEAKDMHPQTNPLCNHKCSHTHTHIHNSCTYTSENSQNHNTHILILMNIFQFRLRFFSLFLVNWQLARLTALTKTLGKRSVCVLVLGFLGTLSLKACN